MSSSDPLVRLDVEVKALRTVFEIQEMIDDNMKVQLSQHSVNIRGMDMSHISLTDITLEEKFCDKFYVQGTMSLLVRSDLVRPFVARLDNNKVLKATFGITRDNVELVALNSPFNERFTIKRTDNSESPSVTPLPKLSFTAVIQMPISKFLSMINTVKDAGDYIGFQSSPETRRLKVVCHGRDNDARAELYIEDSKILKGFKIESNSKANYSLDYVIKFLSVLCDKIRIPGDTPLTMEYQSKFPLKFTVNIYGLTIAYYLAPRVEDD